MADSVVATPQETAGRGWALTGNHYVAFPMVSTDDGGIHEINVVHRGALGLLEWAGTRETVGPALLTPDLLVDGEPTPLRDLEWTDVDFWIPRFRADLGDRLGLEATLCAPGGGEVMIPGAVYRFEFENRGTTDREVEIGLAGHWAWSLKGIVSRRPVSAENRIFRGPTVPGIALGIGGEPGLAALAVSAGPDGEHTVEIGPDERRSLAEGEEVTAANGEPLRFRIGRTIRVPAGRRASATFYLAVAVEPDGALERAAALRRTGAAELIRIGRLQLAQMARKTRDPILGALLHRNLYFSVFFGAGRAIDDDRLFPVVSRSPAARMSAVFRERDTLLWSLPALHLADPNLARELLLRAFEQYSHRAGAHLHYLDGGVLSPAFALDQFCAYAVALDRYIRETGDREIVEEPIIREVLRELDELLLDRAHPEILLCSTEVLPSGAPAVHPYVTYDNVLVWAFCRALDQAWPADAEDAPPNFTGAAEEVAHAIWRHCTAEVDGLRVLAWSTDLAGEAAIYDDPEGSLMLLPALGFCESDDPIWRNTCDLLHSSAYPFWLGDRPFPGMASKAAPGLASLPGLCAELLGPRRKEALATLRGLKLEAGIASETYDPETGRTATAPYQAAVAGLLAWTLWEALAT